MNVMTRDITVLAEKNGGDCGRSAGRKQFEPGLFNQENKSTPAPLVSEADIRATAQKDGMRTMREDGERWLLDGTTTQAELLRVTKD